MNKYTINCMNAYYFLIVNNIHIFRSQKELELLKNWLSSLEKNEAIKLGNLSADISKGKKYLIGDKKCNRLKN